MGHNVNSMLYRINLVLPESLFRLLGPVATDSPLTARTTLTPRDFNFSKDDAT